MALSHRRPKAKNDEAKQGERHEVGEENFSNKAPSSFRPAFRLHQTFGILSFCLPLQQKPGGDESGAEQDKDVWLTNRYRNQAENQRSEVPPPDRRAKTQRSSQKRREVGVNQRSKRKNQWKDCELE